MNNDVMQSMLSLLLQEVDPLFERITQLNWKHILSLLTFFVLALLVGSGLLLLNESVNDYYQKKRLRSHILHISNQGNVPSVFLLRTIDLSDQFAIRFRINHEPMIWVTRKDKMKPEDSLPEPEDQPVASSETEAPAADRNPGLIPDLNRPMIGQQAEETVSKVFKSAEKVGKKAGLLASILSSFSYLVGLPSSGVKNAVSALKNVQQSVNNTISGANAAIGQAEALRRQIGSLAGSDVNTSGAFSETAMNAANKLPLQEENKPEENGGSEEIITAENFQELFTYDESTWEKNVYAKDADGGALIYAQSKVLSPGESMDITLEIMNLSRYDASARSLLYQIEVIQIPQTQLAVSSIRHRLHGLVIFPKVPLKAQLMPFLIMNLVILLCIFLLLRFSYVFLFI